jgi:protein-tyrosine-phosphatase
LKRHSILFVCTKLGARSLLAAHLVNNSSPWGRIAVAAGFEAGRLPNTFFDLISSLGVEPPREKPPTLFERFDAGETYSRVIMICSEVCGEQCPIFYVSVNELFGAEAQVETWNIEDFSQFQGSPEQRREQFQRAVDVIRAKVDALMQELATE